MLRVPVDGAVLFFKASGAPQAIEVRLVKLLATWRDDVIAPLASDEDRAWMLMRDGGTRLRDTADNKHFATWAALVQEYADLQRTVAPHVDELLGVGVRDFRLERLPDLYAGLVEDEIVTSEVDAVERGRLVAWHDELRELCAELASFEIPPTIEHNDLHASNVFLDADKVFFVDWGDSSVSHPFHTMRTTLPAFAEMLGITPDDSRVTTVRDAYLGEFGDVAELLRPFAIAQQTAIVTKALTFVPFVRAMPEPFRERYGFTVANVLKRVLDE